MTKTMKIVVAGASGYIGKAMIPVLIEHYPNAQIIALSRSLQKSVDPRVAWKACDLFSLKSIEEAIPEEIDLAYYLVHSMGPTAHLDQGTFADYDLLLADNFARSIQKAKVRHLIYLGGLIPERCQLSLHLQSRLEVEEIFAQYRIPMTVFRAGLILGEGGSSFQILLKLVKRLPVMICPRWTQTLTTPVDLLTVINALVVVALESRNINQIYDLAGCKSLTYLEMMKETAKALGKKRLLLTVPFFTPTLSRFWVSLVTQSPKDLVYPLIESLEHPMVARELSLFSREGFHVEYSDLLKKVSLRVQPRRSLFRFRPKVRTVRSVQRLPLPEGKDAEWIKDRFVKWIPHFLKPVVKVRIDGSLIRFSIFNDQWVMLELKMSEERSSRDRQLFYIMRGFLVGSENQGRLEFRVVLNRRYIVAAIHDYRPALPWFIYRFTQAKLHLFVMRGFASELKV